MKTVFADMDVMLDNRLDDYLRNKWQKKKTSKTGNLQLSIWMAADIFCLKVRKSAVKSPLNSRRGILPWEN